MTLVSSPESPPPDTSSPPSPDEEPPPAEPMPSVMPPANPSPKGSASPAAPRDPDITTPAASTISRVRSSTWPAWLAVRRSSSTPALRSMESLTSSSPSPKLVKRSPVRSVTPLSSPGSSSPSSSGGSTPPSVTRFPVWESGGITGGSSSVPKSDAMAFWVIAFWSSSIRLLRASISAWRRAISSRMACRSVELCELASWF